jgi:hypothetical protein
MTPTVQLSAPPDWLAMSSSLNGAVIDLAVQTVARHQQSVKGKWTTPGRRDGNPLLLQPRFGFFR